MKVITGKTLSNLKHFSTSSILAIGNKRIVPCHRCFGHGVNPSINPLCRFGCVYIVAPPTFLTRTERFKGVNKTFTGKPPFFQIIVYKTSFLCNHIFLNLIKAFTN